MITGHTQSVTLSKCYPGVLLGSVENTAINMHNEEEIVTVT